MLVLTYYKVGCSYLKEKDYVASKNTGYKYFFDSTQNLCIPKYGPGVGHVNKL